MPAPRRRRDDATPDGPVFPATVVIDNQEKRGYGFAAVPHDADPDDVTGDCPDPARQPYTFAAVPADAGQGGGVIAVATEVVNLPWGDYSLKGCETRVAVERKSVGDLFRTIGCERARFIRELEALNAYEFAAVVVEAEWSDILAGPPPHSKTPPKTIRRSVVAWMHRFPQVHWDFLPGRAAAEVATFRHLQRWWADRQK